MMFTNKEEVRKLLNKIITSENSRELEKVIWYIGFLEGYIGQTKLEEIQK